MLVVTEWMLFTAPENKVAMLGVFPTEVEGKHRQLHAVCALHALAEVLEAREDLLWSSCGSTQITKPDYQHSADTPTAFPLLGLLSLNGRLETRDISTLPP